MVLTFFICWAPHHAQRLLAVYGDSRQGSSFNYIFDYLTYASGVLYFTSTCINPFLYSLMSYKFREAFKVRLLKKWCSSYPTLIEIHILRLFLRFIRINFFYYYSYMNEHDIKMDINKSNLNNLHT